MPGGLKEILSRKKNTETSKRRPSKPRPAHSDFEKRLVIVVNANALVQLLADIVLEILHLVPTRINHLSLTVLNAFMAYKTLSAVHKGKFQFLHEDLQVLWLMEVCLIAGDVFHMIYYPFDVVFFYFRLGFLVCSLFNWAVVTGFIYKYKLWHISYQGHKEKRHSISNLNLKSMVALWKAKSASNKIGVASGSASADGTPSDAPYIPVPLMKSMSQMFMGISNEAKAERVAQANEKELAKHGKSVTRSSAESNYSVDSEGESGNGGEKHPIFGKNFGAQSDSDEDEERPSTQRLLDGGRQGSQSMIYPETHELVSGSQKNTTGSLTPPEPQDAAASRLSGAPNAAGLALVGNRIEDDELLADSLDREEGIKGEENV